MTGATSHPPSDRSCLFSIRRRGPGQEGAGGASSVPTAGGTAPLRLGLVTLTPRACHPVPAPTDGTLRPGASSARRWKLALPEALSLGIGWSPGYWRQHEWMRARPGQGACLGKRGDDSAPALGRAGLGATGDGAWGGEPACAGCSAWPAGLRAQAGMGNTEEALSRQGFNPSSPILSCFSPLVGGENGARAGSGAGQLKLLSWPALLGMASVRLALWQPPARAEAVSPPAARSGEAARSLSPQRRRFLPSLRNPWGWRGGARLLPTAGRSFALRWCPGEVSCPVFSDCSGQRASGHSREPGARSRGCRRAAPPWQWPGCGAVGGDGSQLRVPQLPPLRFSVSWGLAWGP